MIHAPSATPDPRETVKYLLRLRGLTLAAIAHDLNITGPTVSIVLTGKRRSRRVAEYVASALDSTVDELWPGVYSNGED